MNVTAVHTLQAVALAAWLLAWMLNFDWYERLHAAEKERRR